MAGKNEQLPLTKHSNKIIPNDIFTYFSGFLFVFSSLKHLFCNILKSLSVNLTLVSFTHNLFGYQYIVWLLLISFNYKRQNYAFKLELFSLQIGNIATLVSFIESEENRTLFTCFMPFCEVSKYWNSFCWGEYLISPVANSYICLQLHYAIFI